MKGFEKAFNSSCEAEVLHGNRRYFVVEGRPTHSGNMWPTAEEAADQSPVFKASSVLMKESNLHSAVWKMYFCRNI